MSVSQESVQSNCAPAPSLPIIATAGWQRRHLLASMPACMKWWNYFLPQKDLRGITLFKISIFCDVQHGKSGIGNSLLNGTANFDKRPEPGPVKTPFERRIEGCSTVAKARASPGHKTPADF